MNNETLKRDLCARLFENLKVKDDYGMIGTLTSISTNESYECVSVVYNGETDMLHIEEIKPILFQTSALTKQIQIASYNNGEPFVPVEEMCRYFYNHSIKSKYRIENNGVFTICEHKNGESIYVLNDYKKIDYWIIELLNRWHINYRLSPEQFIEVTDEFNPYL